MRIWRRFFGKKANSASYSLPVQGDVSVIIEALEESQKELVVESKAHKLVTKALKIWKR